MERSEKVKVIANHYYMQQYDNRSQSEVLEHMQDWAVKGWLSKAFIEGCYKAIDDGLQVEITYDPKQPCYGYLSGTPEAWKGLANMKGKPITIVDAAKEGAQ